MVYWRLVREWLVMKTMTCKQLAGACDEKFHAETFEEMAEMSKKHAMEMVETGDKEHKEKMEEMKTLMKDPDAVKAWFEKVQKEFDALPED
jgi:hypothetical protein